VEAAIRELEEETGYRAASMTELFGGPASAGLSSETMTFFRAEGLKKVGLGGGDDAEDIVVHEVPLDEVEDWVRRYTRENDCLLDMKVFAGVYFAMAVLD
jgi:ADP-ribose pyrophosphatase